ncbi:MAG: DNA polymerase I [Bacteroidia bacterium]|nr:DNA polymerase I [Bacteroidia bacterium]
MARKKLFLLDAMALLYRAHFAFIKNPRITSKGLNTSAVFGFINTLLEIIGKENPTHLAVATDTSAPTFRHVRFEAYKANREEMPEALRTAIPYTYRLLEALRIPLLRIDGYEADDLIGTLSVMADAADFDVYMVTPDKDYAQLVQDHIFLYRPAFSGGFEIMDAAAVEEKFGVPPARITDFLGLKGDAVDNIPGIPKVGDKTALELITAYGTLENIIAQADTIAKKSIRETVQTHAEQGLLSKELAIIKTDVPVEVNIAGLELGFADLEALMPLLEELEFKTLGQRILGSRLNPVRPEPQRDLFGQEVGNQVVEMPGFRSLDDITTRPHTYHLVTTGEARAALRETLRAAGGFCFDTETTGLDPMQAEIVGISFAVTPGEAWFIHFPGDMPRETVQGILDEFAPLLTDTTLAKYGQNLKYDMTILRNYGIRVDGPMFDTMLAHYVLTPEAKHNMDDMSAELLKYKPVSIETLIGKKGKKQLSMRDVPVEPLVEYACEDSDITLALKESLAPLVLGNRIFETIEQPLMPVLADMEFEGVRIDPQFLADYSVELEQRADTLEQEIYALAGEKFNINSPKQLGEVLFDKMDLGKGKKQTKTATGQYVTDEQVLSDLALSHELPGRILAYRSVKKLKSTYVDTLPKMIHPRTGRVHTTYRQTVAVTGRLSSENPNLQNIPIRTDDGREVRKGFIARDADHVLMSADYSQVELRIMAAMSGDTNMIAAFQAGMDIHRASAARVFGVPVEAVTPEMRSAAKTVNFGIIYGISAFGLSQRMGISRAESKDIIDTYFRQYSGIKTYMDQCVEQARERGYVETWFGRRRYLADINSRNATVRAFAERNAINSPIQGTAADIIKLAMIRIQQALQTAGLQSRMILQVHDELVFDVHRHEIEVMKDLVRTHMIGAIDLVVPMEVEIGLGDNWLEAH